MIARCLLSGAIVGSLALAACSEPPRRTDVILITVDTLRADHLSCYGYPRDTSPHLDRLAADGVVFERCISHSPVTAPSCASLLSGFLPHETKTYEGLPMPGEVATLAEILVEEGYRTAAVISNYVLRRKSRFDQGFLTFDDTMTDAEVTRNVPERIAEHTTDRAIQILEEPRDGPLFLWVHYQDPHGPYTPPGGTVSRYRDPDTPPRPIGINPSLSGRGGIPSYQALDGVTDFHEYVARYDSEIAYFDREFGRLLDALRDNGLYDEALIVFTADHGEGMGEHNYFFAHGENLYHHQTHVPLILRHGDRFSGRRADFVQHLDVMPTILGALGLPVDSRMRGVDLARVDADRAIVSIMRSELVRERHKYSLVRDGFKLIYTPDGKRSELFDLSDDPGEIRDLVHAPAHEERLRDMTRRLRTIIEDDRLGIRVSGSPPRLSPEEKAKLESLGYAR